MHVLTPLTNKIAKNHFSWTADHQYAFKSIKALIIGADCLTIVDHTNPGKNKVFVTCDASDWCMGACLSLGETWETAWPVTYNSMQLSPAEKNYPIHKKELLVVVRDLKKWQLDLLGTKFTVYTDHRTLENFNTQRDLSRRQLRWQEFMLQYEMNIVYICGEDNCVADALLHIPEGAFPSEQPTKAMPPAPYLAWKLHIGMVLSISTDQSVLRTATKLMNSVFVLPKMLPLELASSMACGTLGITL